MTCAGIAIVALFVWLTLLCYPFIIDDAFISFRYSENLVRGHGLVFNPGERVEGYTNFLWVMVMAGVYALTGESLAWSKALGVGANLITLLLTGVAAWRIWGRSPHAWLAFLPPLLLAINFGFVLTSRCHRPQASSFPGVTCTTG
jgi:hypothetical protein